MAPLALAGSLSALLLPRIEHSYQRFAWLRLYNYLQLAFLILNVIELIMPLPRPKQALASLDYLFLGSGPVIWFLFSLEYTSFARHFRPWQILFFLPPLLVGLAALANGENGLVWQGLEFRRVGWLLVMRSSHYGLVAISLFVYDYLIIVVGAAVLFRHTVLSHKLYRRQTAWLIAGIVLPLVVHFLYVAKFFPDWKKDFSSIAGALGGFCFSFGCLRHRLFSVVPISRQMVIQQMKVGMIVTDAEGRIIDLNQAACSMLGRSEISLLGTPSAPLLAQIEKLRFDLSRQPVKGPDGQIAAWHFELRERGAEPAPETPPPAVDPAESPILSLGELRVVEMLALNLANKEISDRLGLSVNTVKFHLANVYRKTGTRNRAELVATMSEIVNRKAT
jgi:DNA-binding CsgD family transcriptional regulator